MENGNQNKEEFGFGLGRRIVELGYLAEQMKSCPNCSTPLYLHCCKKERLYGLGSILYIECQSCKKELKIYTGKQHRSQNTVKGMKIWDVNTKCGLAMDHAGLGPYQVSNFLTALNLPSIHPSTLRARENEIGSTLKTYTKESCDEALLSEASATSKSGKDEEDDKSPINITFDAPWQKRGSGRSFNSRSASRETATWWVNLITIYSIRHITIHFMTGGFEFGPDNPYPSFFLGFSVYISNSTEMSQGTQCYKDDSFTTNTIPAVFTTTCPVHGQYVIYYNERQPNVMYPNDYSPNVHNNLCEVEVHGCPVVGYYGPNCSFRCPNVNCQFCHIETGTCQGCKPGYRGHQCEIDCPYGFFGRNCANSCNKTCDGCNNVNGRCEFGCLPGWKGDSCQIACDKGSYGIDCNKTCGQCRETDQCRITDGRCLTGCDAGYQGDFCTESCKTGSFGFDCNETCGHCSEVNHCSDIDGICQTGCKAGYQGDLCRSSCDKGSYGVNCNQRCGFCHDANQCSHINGKCLSGCLAGYQGEICKTVNVALNKPAYQQFPYISKNGTADKFHARNAVDGRRSDLSWDGGQCSFSNGNQTATWWVNLTSVHSIHHITIYFMTDNRTWGSSNTFTNHFLGFSVYVSNTTDRLQGTLCFKDNSFIADTIPAVFTTTCPVYGQYVIYFNDILLEGSNSRLAYSDLCEVEVYGVNTANGFIIHWNNHGWRSSKHCFCRPNAL